MRPMRLPSITIRGAMQLRDVCFRYPQDVADKPQPLVLHDVNIRVDPGQTVAICGPSGAGKSTVLNLLLRFYDPAEGTVLLDRQGYPLGAARQLSAPFCPGAAGDFSFQR